MKGEMSMSMPQIPEAKNRPNLKETVIDLLESIALEEIALSHIINAEAEKIQAFVGKDLNFPITSSGADIIKFNQAINQMMDTLIMKEWILYKKLDKVMQIDFENRYQFKGDELFEEGISIEDNFEE